MGGAREFVGIADSDNPNTLVVNPDGSINVDGFDDGTFGSVIRGQEDIDTFNKTITAGGSDTVEVNTSNSNRAILLIDDGTTGGEPAQYDLSQAVYVDDLADYMFYDSVEKETARSWTDPTFGSKLRATITNVSGSDANYRAVLISYRGM